MATTPLALECSHYVLYLCHCSRPVTIESLYFCRHCKLLRCMDCVSVHIDGTCISCPSCNDSVPQADAKAKKFRCTHCYQCPMCSTPLATRFVQLLPSASSSSPGPLKSDSAPNPTEKEGSPVKEGSPKRGSDPAPLASATTTPKSTKPLHHRASLTPSSSFKSPAGTKMYYLFCTHCHWTTREVDIPDKRSLLDFKDKPHPFQDRYKALLSYYKDFDLYERVSSQSTSRQFGRKPRPFSSLLDTGKYKKEAEMRPLKQVQSVALPAKDPTPLPDSLYTDPVDVTSLTTIEQKLMHPSHQPSSMSDLWPRPLPLISRKTIRCRGCDHILLKPDVNVNLVRFKIQHVAIQVCPRIRLLHVPKLTLGEPSLVPLSLTSPVSYNMTVSFDHLPFSKKIKEILCPTIVPEGSFTLKSLDDTSDLLDESSDSKSDLEVGVDGQKEFVLSSEPGRLILKFAVIPSSLEFDAKMAFVIRFSYEPVIEADREPGGIELSVPVLVNCGHSFV